MVSDLEQSSLPIEPVFVGSLITFCLQIEFEDIKLIVVKFDEFNCWVFGEICFEI